MFEHHPNLVGGGHPRESYSFLDFVLTPHFFGAAVVLIIVLVYGAIRVKKAGISFASKSTISSGPTLSATMVHHSSPRVADYFTRSVKLITHNSLANSFTGFWRRFPRRVWNFYISTFIIHRYRPEWGKYKNWCSRAPLRPKKHHPKIRPSLLRLKHKKIDLLAKKSANDIKEALVPKPASHNHVGCQRIRINVGGCIYETQARTLSRFPNTLLGDPNKRLRYFNPAKQEYFFDRNRVSFEVILHYYQSGGRFKRPDNISTDILLDDAKFYGFPQAVIYQFLCDEGLSTENQAQEILPANMLLRKIWLLFDFPHSSVQAQIVSLISVVAIVLSITTFCIETLASLSGRNKFTLDSTTYKVSRHGYDPLDLSDPFFFTETICSAWFILEYFARLASSPVKLKFLVSTLNIIDLIAILPYFVQLISTSGDKRDDDEGLTSRRSASGVSVIRVVRLVRVFRIFKLSRYSRGLKILGKTLHASLNELMLLIFFVLIGVILFSSTMYFAELGTENTDFPSIPDGFWWALITLTTLGYGDNVPKTTWGKMVGAVCAVAGVLTLALPVPVIVSNFNFFYHQALGESDLSWIRISHTPSCPFRPMGSSPGDDLSLQKDAAVNEPSKKHQEGSSKSTISKNKPVDIYSSDEEFGELKSRAKEQNKKKKIQFAKQ